MRTSTSSYGTTGKTRRAPVVLTMAAVCIALPMSALLGGSAYAATTSGSDSAALKVTSDKGNSEAAKAAAEEKKSDKAASTAVAAAPQPGDPGFVGPVAKGNDKKDAAPAADTSAKGAAQSSSAKADPQPTPFTNAGGVTTGSNTTKYETVADKKGATYTGKGGGQPSGDIHSPQPYSNADKNNTGANDTSASNPYKSTRDGSPSLNGNGGGKQVGQPCAGCVGKADNKNPKGQAPGGSDHNAGYECDRNHGIGRSNPAHTACTPGTVVTYDCAGHPLPNNHDASECDQTKYDCKGHKLPNNHDASECDETKYDCKGHKLPNNHDASECDQTKYDCKGHKLPNNHDASECDETKYDCKGHKLPNNHDASECTKDEVDQKVTLCHATHSAKNPYVVITVSVNSVVKKSGHDGHGGDVIPAFSYTDKDGTTRTYAGKNLGDISKCNVPTPPKDCKGVVNGTATMADCTPGKDCKGVVNGTATMADCTPGKDCKGVVNGTATDADCKPPVVIVCPSGMTNNGNGCENPGVITPEQPVEGEKPVKGNTDTPVTVINGRPSAPATADDTALPFTGTDALLMAQLAGLLLLVGGGLVGLGRKKKAIRAL